MKRFCFLILVCCIIGMFSGVYAESDKSITETNEMKISISGKICTFKDPLIIVDGILMAPLKELVARLGVKDDDVNIFTSIGNKMTAIIYKEDGFIIIETDSKWASVTNKPIELDATPPIYKGQVYAPVMFIAESLNKGVVWNAATSTVVISENRITETTKLKVSINGEVCTFKDPLIIVDEILMAPLKELAVKLGIEDDDIDIISFKNDMTAFVEKRDCSIEINTGSKLSTVNHKSVKLDVAPLIYRSQMYVPVRFLAQNLDEIVEWDAGTSTIKISDIVLPEPGGWKRMKDRPNGNERLTDKLNSGLNGLGGFIISSSDQNKAVVIDNKVYMIDNDGTVKEYNPTADTWADTGKIGALLNSKGFFKLVTMNKKILIVGANYRDVLEYDIYTKQCTLKTRLPSPRQIGAAVVENGKLYILSGELVGDPNTLNTMDVYDPVTNIWTSKKDMFEGASDLAAAALNGKIYIFGAVRSSYIDGFFNKDAYHGQNIEVYDIKTDTWQYITLDIPWFVSEIVVLNGKLYLFGHRLAKDTYKEECTVIIYDPYNEKWEEVADMLPKEYGYATAPVSGKIYVIEGKKVEQFTPSNNSPKR